MLTKSERYYLKQADAAADGVIREGGRFGAVPLKHLVKLGYLSFEGVDYASFQRTYRLTDAGRAALEGGPVTDVPLVEHPSGRDNAAARRAGVVDTAKRDTGAGTDMSAPRSSAFDDSQARQSSVTRDTLTPVAAHPRTSARALVHQATCVQCGKAFDACRSDAKTCSPTCRKAYSRRGQELLKAYDEARRAVAEIGARLRQYPDLAEVAAANLRELHDQVGHLLGYYEDMYPTG